MAGCLLVGNIVATQKVAGSMSTTDVHVFQREVLTVSVWRLQLPVKRFNISITGKSGGPQSSSSRPPDSCAGLQHPCEPQCSDGKRMDGPLVVCAVNPTYSMPCPFH